ncbi:MAG: UDP-3-O-(3-hydroxymyristoyl)glucosamine N-acyltransferase, partial [Dehalococcoidia bacterium]|nr:UDP-3-O-(3-hydroxymyristoyl)glucosamine N-acyltransferase [Dehalococcoidia bacterium]
MLKQLNISALAEMVEGKIAGNFSQDIEITGTCAVDKYAPNKVAFVKNEKYGELLSQLQKAIVLIPESLAGFCSRYPQNAYIIVEDVVSSLMDLQDFFYKDRAVITDEGISSTAKVDESARIGKNVLIGDGTKVMHNCCISNSVAIGNDTYIYPETYIYKNCQIGNHCIIHSGVRIGRDGFRFEQDIEHRKVRKMISVGRVTIGDRVEVGANCTIDRATFENDATTIFDDVKLADQAHIGHNASIGARTCIAVQTCVSGSARIGEDVWIAPGVTISDNVKIGDRARLLLNAVVAYDVPQD